MTPFLPTANRQLPVHYFHATAWLLPRPLAYSASGIRRAGVGNGSSLAAGTTRLVCVATGSAAAITGNVIRLTTDGW